MHLVVQFFFGENTFVPAFPLITTKLEFMGKHLDNFLDAFLH